MNRCEFRRETEFQGRWISRYVVEVVNREFIVIVIVIVFDGKRKELR